MTSTSPPTPSRQAFRLTGRVLYLTQDPELLRRQLDGEDLPFDPDRPLLDDISTDEISPAWACFHQDRTIGRYALVGLRGGVVTEDAVRSGGFQVVVSGRSKGCGSSREHAPFAEQAAGIELVLARSLEKIYGQNCQNIGLLTSTDLDLIPRLLAGQAVPLDALTEGLEPIAAEVVRSGGLFAYNKRRLAGEVSPPPVERGPRPMTLVEKILARHTVRDPEGGVVGVPAVAPGDAVFVQAAVRFSHEYVTPMADALFRDALGENAAIKDPETVYTFQDHLAFLGRVMPPEKRRLGLLDKAEGLAATQRAFAERHGVTLYGEVEGGGASAICHNAVVEDLAMPGTVVVGTDSHTCMAGVLGCVAFGVGSTDMANAWYTGDVRVRVPETVRFVLENRLGDGVSAKDVMLYLLRQPFFRSSQGIGKVLEFAGDGVRSLSLDERATLTNMAVEAGGFTGIIEPDDTVLDYLEAMRGRPRDELRGMVVRGDRGAHYQQTFHLDLAAVPPMVATPGDPRNGVPLAELSHPPDRIDIAYGGSCTGGKIADMDMYARVFQAALDQGRRVAPGVQAFIQFGSLHIEGYARRRGYDRLFSEAGVSLLRPSCGACINAGPGASRDPDTITVSAQNRNFPGRSGPGQVYLASPMTVAASAILGRLASPAELLVPADRPPQAER